MFTLGIKSLVHGYQYRMELCLDTLFVLDSCIYKLQSRIQFYACCSTFCFSGLQNDHSGIIKYLGKTLRESCIEELFITNIALKGAIFHLWMIVLKFIKFAFSWRHDWFISLHALYLRVEKWDSGNHLSPRLELINYCFLRALTKSQKCLAIATILKK